MKNKKEIRDLLSTGSKGKKGNLIATQTELGYKVGDKIYTEDEFEALSENYENVITFVVVKNTIQEA